MVRHDRVRAADRRPLRQHGPQPVPRTRRVERGLLVVPLVPAGRTAAARVPVPGEQRLQPRGVRQPERRLHVGHVRPDHRLLGRRRLDRTRSTSSGSFSSAFGSSSKRAATRTSCAEPGAARVHRARFSDARAARSGMLSRMPVLAELRLVDLRAVLARAVAVAAQPAHRRCRRSRSTRFRRRRATRVARAHTRRRRRAPPDAGGRRRARPRAARLGAVGRRARRYGRAQALAPRAFEWPYLDAVVLQRLARTRRGRRAARGARRVARLPAGARQARGGAARGRRARGEPAAVRGARREPAGAPAAHFGLGRIAAPRAGTPTRSRTSSGRSRCFPSSALPTTRSRASYRALGRARRRASARSSSTRGTARAGRRSTIRCSRGDRAARRCRARSCSAASSWRKPAISQGAIAAHEAALARDPTLAQAHANLINLYGRARNWAKAEEHYRAAVALGRQPRRRALRLRRAARDAGAMGGGRRGVPPRARVNPLHAQARNNLGQLLERQRQFEEAAARVPARGRGQPTFRLARFNLGRMLHRAGRSRRGDRRVREAAEPRDAETPRYLFALAHRARARRHARATALKWANEAKRWR